MGTTHKNGNSTQTLQMATTALYEAEIVSVSLVYPIITSLITKHLVINGEDLAAVKSSKILLEMT